MRTASAGGSCPCAMKRRTFAYDARSTSMEKVETGFARASRNGFSTMCAYSSVLNRAESVRAPSPTPWAAGLPLLAHTTASTETSEATPWLLHAAKAAVSARKAATRRAAEGDATCGRMTRSWFEVVAGADLETSYPAELAQGPAPTIRGARLAPTE